MNGSSSIFPWSKPCKDRKLPKWRGLGFNNVLSQTHITAVAELKFEALEVGVEKAIIQPDQTDTNGDKSQEQKEVEEQIKKLQEKNQHPKD